MQRSKEDVMPKRFSVVAMVVPATALALVFAAPAFGRSYDVTIKDLTDGQPLTPPAPTTSCPFPAARRPVARRPSPCMTAATSFP
jgi:hypothetical protein